MKTYFLTGCAVAALSLMGSVSAWANPAIGTLADAQGKAKRVGTATLINDTGHIITSSALVGRNDTMYFTYGDGNETLPASVVAANDDLGIALLRLDTVSAAAPSPIIFSKNISAKGSIVTALSRNGGALATTDGAVSNTLVTDGGGVRFLKHNALITPSGYGGVLANECGEALGFNVVDPFLSMRRARQLPDLDGAVYASDISGVLSFLDARGVNVAVASQNCLTAEEKAAELEKKNKQDKNAFEKEKEEKQAELDRVQQDLIDKQKASIEAQERADQAERDAKRKAAEVERLKKDKKASALEREAAEEEAEAARKAAEQAAIDAAERAEEIAKLKAEQDALQIAVDESKKRQKQLMIGGGIGFALLTLLAGLMLGRRSKALKAERIEKAGVIQKLNETFSDIECRGQDQNNAPHAFIISGNSLLKSPQGLVVGRQPQSSDILINHPEISRAHLRASLKNGTVYVEDLSSTNGSMLNHAPLLPNVAMPLRSGDTLSLGKITFQVRFLDA